MSTTVKTRNAVILEKTVDIPPRRFGAATGKYPFDKLKVNGRPMVIRGTSSKRFGATVWRAAQRLGYRFTIRTIKKNGVPSVYIWRIQ